MASDTADRSRWRLYLDFTRPFTLLPPLIGVLSGALTAWGSSWNPHVLAGEPRRLTWGIVITVLAGSACAALLNAASNVINQIYDLENDRLNKPDRPLITGMISMRAAGWFAAVLYACAVLPTWFVVTWPTGGPWLRAFEPLARHECFWIFVAGMGCTFVYSAPKFGRTKADTFLSNLTIALPRGLLLKVAGWSMVASAFHLEPWFIGVVFFLFLLGASTTKDFSDMRGDAAAGCRTLPIRFGVRRAARMIAPFFVVPWLLLPLGAWAPLPGDRGARLLSGNPWALTLLGLVLALWGAYTCRLILRDPQSLAERENHPSWTHMYLMMMTAQIGFAVAYLI